MNNTDLLEQVRKSHLEGSPTQELISMTTELIDAFLTKHPGFKVDVDLELLKQRIFFEDDNGDYCLWKNYDESKSQHAIAWFTMMISAEMLRQKIANRTPRTCKLRGTQD